MKIGKGKITTKKSGNGGYKSVWLYIPSGICKDELFPFDDNEEVLIEIEDSSLIISKNDDRSKIISNFGRENATLPKLLEIKAEQNKDKPFLYFKDRRYSYEDINHNANMVAHGILTVINELELKRPKISLLMNNCPEYLFSWFGIAKAGAIFVPIHKPMKAEMLEFVLNNSDSEILMIDYEFLSYFEKIKNDLPKLKRIIIRNAPSDYHYDNYYLDFSSLVSTNSENLKINIFNEDPSEILYSEGVIGDPKGVVYRNVVLPGISIGYELKDVGLNDVTKIFCPLPLSQGSAQFYVIIPSLFYDKSVVLTETFNARTFWEEIQKYNPSCFFYFGGYLTDLLYQKPTIQDRNHSIKFAYGFGAVVELWNAFEKRFGIPLFECWSHSEGIGMTMNKVGSKGGKIGSIGTPPDFIELKIVDTGRNEIPPGPNNIGEIAVRMKSNSLFEYYKQPENTDVRIDEDNWVYTGDYGYKDYDGFVYFKGKRKEVIKKGNDVICIRDIERIANSHPNILETAVLPLVIGKSNEIEMKIIAVRVKNRSITYEELSEFLFHNLAYSHVPRYIEFKEEVPKGSATEFLKRILLEEWENEKSKCSTWDTQIQNFLD
ncbi:MAG: AMP-binding protein [Promethearchaeota archaeon]